MGYFAKASAVRVRRAVGLARRAKGECYHVLPLLADRRSPCDRPMPYGLERPADGELPQKAEAIAEEPGGRDDVTDAPTGGVEPRSDRSILRLKVIDDAEAAGEG